MALLRDMIVTLYFSVHCLLCMHVIYMLTHQNRQTKQQRIVPVGGGRWWSPLLPLLSYNTLWVHSALIWFVLRSNGIISRIGISELDIFRFL